MNLDELENWLSQVELELAFCGIGAKDIEVSVNRIGNKQLLNVKHEGDIEATKVW